jgi:putative endonuclease
MPKQPAIYILTNKKNGTLYTGVTSNLVQRVWQHKNKKAPGFTVKYECDILVYFELYEDMVAAITREKQLKSGSRQKKLQLIESINPHWQDLYDTIIN